MQYGTMLNADSDPANQNLFNNDFSHMRYVGYQNKLSDSLFANENLNLISRQITQFLKGFRDDQRDIIVPIETIASVLSSVYENFRPQSVGSIYGRYNIPGDNPDSENYLKHIINQTIEIIVTDVKTNLGIEENNKKLSIWTTVLGEGINEHGLRSFPPIKLREKRPSSFQFHMKY
jgi:hypothetical protein